MLIKLKATLAHHPLAWFFALVGAAWLVYIGLMAAASPTVANEWTLRFQMVSAMAAGLIALVCCWAISGPRSRPPQRFTQLFIVVAAVLVSMAVLCVNAWLEWRTQQSFFVASAGSTSGGASPGVSWPSLGSWIYRELGTPILWLRALVVGLVLAGVASPFAAARRLARRLIEWRGRRVWLLVALGLLVPAACAIAADVGGHLAPLHLDGGAAGRFHYSLSASVADFVTALIGSVPLVFAWYGFVGDRLARRVSPLVAALVIGLAISLSYQLELRVGLCWFGGGGWYVLSVLGQIALAVPAAWLARKARGSLIPTAVLLAAYPAGANVVVWAGATSPVYFRVQDLYPGGIIAAAVLFALLGHMWRRSDAPPSLLALDESTPASGGSRASVGRVGVPLEDRP
jgi:hypothetical protein